MRATPIHRVIDRNDEPNSAIRLNKLRLESISHFNYHLSENRTNRREPRAPHHRAHQPRKEGKPQNPKSDTDDTNPTRNRATTPSKPGPTTHNNPQRTPLTKLPRLPEHARRERQRWPHAQTEPALPEKSKGKSIKAGGAAPLWVPPG